MLDTCEEMKPLVNVVSDAIHCSFDTIEKAKE